MSEPAAAGAASGQAASAGDAKRAPEEVEGCSTSSAGTAEAGASPDQQAVMELIFKVANAAVGVVAYEVAKGSSTPPASGAPPRTPQKQRRGGQKGRTPQAQTPLTWGSSSRADDTEEISPTQAGEADDDDEYVSDDDALDDLEEGEDEEEAFSQSVATPKGRGRAAPYRASGAAGYNAGRRPGGKNGPMQLRSHASMQRELRPPPPPPSGSLKALPPESVQRFLKLVQVGDYSEALKELRKVRRAVKGRGCSKEAFGGTRALLHHLLEGYASAGRLPEALELLGDMKRGAEARLVSAAAFNAVLRGLLARGALEESRCVVREEMPRLGVSPNEASLNLLMDTAARAGPANLEEAWDVLEEMQRRGLRADKYTVSILTKGICERGDKRRMPRGVVLVENFLKSQPDDVDEVLVNSLLDVFCRMGDMPRLEATLAKMREYGIRGSAVTYGTVVKAYGRAGNVEKVLQAWDAMSKEGLEANAVTYGCMLDACVKCGHLERALQVFSQMKEQKLHKNTILYATLIKGFAKSKDPTAARKLHLEMVAEGVPCNVVVFNSLIDACVRANDLSGAAEVLQQMTAAGVRPDLITFSTLIKGYCSTGELHKAMRLSEELQARGLECDEIVYNSLLEGCVKAGDLQQGLRLFTEMRQRSVRPSCVTFSILVKLLSRAGRLDLACHLVSREMRELHGVAPTRMVWSCLATCCLKARDVARAVTVLDMLDREGGAAGGARASMYAAVVEGCLTQGEVGTALSLCERACLRAPPEEGSRGLLSADLLRRVFEAAGARGPEAEARAALDSIAPRLGGQVRSSLEEALGRGAKRRGAGGGSGGGAGSRSSGGSSRGGMPGAGTAEGSSLLPPTGGSVTDALGASAVAAAWAGGCPGTQPWQGGGGFSGLDVSPGGSFPGAVGQWDPSMMAAAAAAAAAAGGDWSPWAQHSEAYGGYGYGGDYSAAFGSPWGCSPWSCAEESMPWAQSGFSPSSAFSPSGYADAFSPTLSTSPNASKVPDTPAAGTPVAASAGKAGERTPATTAGRTSLLERSPPEEDDNERAQLTPLQIRLFPCDGKGSNTAGEGGGEQASRQRVEVPLSALLDGPPGLC